MALFISFTYIIPCTKLHNSIQQFAIANSRSACFNVVTKCQSKESSFETSGLAKITKLDIGSPIIVVEAPQMIKTTTSVPCLRVNTGLVKAGDVGRIVSRKPKDVWAVHLSIGTYLIDGKYLKPVELGE